MPNAKLGPGEFVT